MAKDYLWAGNAMEDYIKESIVTGNIRSGVTHEMIGQYMMRFSQNLAISELNGWKEILEGKRLD